MTHIDLEMKCNRLFKSAIVVVIIISFATIIRETNHLFRHDSLNVITTSSGPDGHKLEGSSSSCDAPLQYKGPSGPMFFHNEQEWVNLNMCELVSKPSLLQFDKDKSFECTHFMKIEGLIGRTGNHIFQVSTLLGAAMYHRYIPVIDRSFPLKKWFDLPNVIDIKLANSRTFIKTTNRNFDSGITHLSHNYNWTLKGILFSWRYFEGAERAIRKGLMLKQKLVKEAKNFMKNTVNKVATTVVCVHVRRGDFLNERFMKQGYAVAPVRYLKDAMAYFRQKFARVHFFALGDDKKWLKTNVNWDNITISPLKSAGLDMALMSLCDHTIITTGTFGWWGAWLAGGDVIYWTGHPRKGSPLDNRTCRYDYFPREWIGMS